MEKMDLSRVVVAIFVLSMGGMTVAGEGTRTPGVGRTIDSLKRHRPTRSAPQRPESDFKSELIERGLKKHALQKPAAQEWAGLAVDMDASGNLYSGMEFLSRLIPQKDSAELEARAKKTRQAMKDAKAETKPKFNPLRVLRRSPRVVPV